MNCFRSRWWDVDVRLRIHAKKHSEQYYYKVRDVVFDGYFDGLFGLQIINVRSFAVSIRDGPSLGLTLRTDFESIAIIYEAPPTGLTSGVLRKAITVGRSWIGPLAIFVIEPCIASMTDRATHHLGCKYTAFIWNDW
jgi:hypothetical protein